GLAEILPLLPQGDGICAHRLPALLADRLIGRRGPAFVFTPPSSISDTLQVEPHCRCYCRTKGARATAAGAGNLGRSGFDRTQGGKTMSAEFDSRGPSGRDFFRAAAASAGAAALMASMGVDPAKAAEMAKETTRPDKPLKAAFSNAGLQATWCAQGKRAAEYW